MKLPDLLKILPEYQAKNFQNKMQSFQITAEVKNLTQDARAVSAGSVYVAIRGTQWDGHQFLQNAVDQGAMALVIEKAQASQYQKILENFQGVVLEVAETREALQRLASHFFGYPSKDLLVFGVTGTNGKTSITYMLEHVLNEMGLPCGVLGTINHHLTHHQAPSSRGSGVLQVWDSSMTTPEPVALQQRIFEMKSLGARAIAMEVSSHALEQKRAHSVMFDRVIFTNLTQDHLDYHGNMDQYFAAKSILFTEILHDSPKFPLFAIVNIDDFYGQRLRVSQKAGILTYGEFEKADFQFQISKVDFSGTEFTLKVSDVFLQEPLMARIPLIGRHNVANIVAVVAALATVGIDPKKSLRSLESFLGVPGRLEKVANRKNVPSFVDYAHTPDALKNVLLALRKVRETGAMQAKIWTVFGCGGDRDKTKRPLMAEIAESLSDFVIVTSDNPRTENPLSILEDICKGFKNPHAASILIEEDRQKAIELALRNASPQDVVLVAGKGHEDYQIIGQEKRSFSDQKVIREC